jgi:predicted pyridoxine 5'-phosphate oxidase superfamily flavin-nucleotide-binding protein
MGRHFGELAFTPSVKRFQAKDGSEAGYARAQARGGRDTVDADLAAFLAQCRSFYLASASAEGWPYLQHRGGPAGFLKPLDERTLGFADYAGNRQFISMGNLAENDRVMLFLPDYAHRQRIKIWGRAKIAEDADLVARLADPGYAAKPQRAVLIALEAWDTNCPQHIPQLVPAEDVVEIVTGLRARVAELEARLAEVRRGT